MESKRSKTWKENLRPENLRRSFWAGVGIILIALVGIVDYLTGVEIAVSLFYLIPISLVVWFAGKELGIMMSAVSAIVWVGTDFLGGKIYSHGLIPYWNGAVELGFFLIVTLLLSRFRKLFEHEKELARTDYLTGAVNSRFFLELSQMEISRSYRYQHPFTVVYLDVDDFKTVNDQLGHHVGDAVLHTVGSCILKHLRKTDVIARLGGDEFALLLPETEQQGAQAAISKVWQSLLDEMQKNNWPVTFSIGVMTYINSPQTADEMIKVADGLMYSVKNKGKNAIAYSVYGGK
jgi:diguanylate cyclase (GGDEF)-like protein